MFMSMEDSEMGCIPLTEAEIDRANRLFEMAEGWSATVEAMDLIRQRLRGFDLPTCLVKFAAVNTLYATNVYAAIRMAKHIHQVTPSNTDSLGRSSSIAYPNSLPGIPTKKSGGLPPSPPSSRTSSLTPRVPDPR